MASTAAFAWQERRAVEPTIPLRLFSSRIVALAFFSSLCAGAAMIAAGSFLPLFLQVLAGASATASGLALAPMMVMLIPGLPLRSWSAHARRDADDADPGGAAVPSGHADR